MHKIEPQAGHPQPMLTQIYIEALLVDPETADQVWEAWDQGKTNDEGAWLAWWLIALNPKQSGLSSTTLTS